VAMSASLYVRQRFPPEIITHCVLLSKIPPQLEAQLTAGRALRPEDVIEQVRVLLAGLNTRRVSELSVALSAVLDCRDVSAMGLTPPLIKPGDLFHDTEYDTGHALAAAALTLRCAALLVPSATGFGDSLIVFPANLGPTDTITLVRSIDAPLFVAR